MRNFARYSLFFCLALLLTTAAQAADTYWSDITGGTFSDAGNWTAGVPGPGDRAFFMSNAIYTVTLTTGVTVTNANVLLDAPGGAITKNGGGTWIVTNKFEVGRAAGTDAEIFHQYGTLIVTNPQGTAELVVGDNGRFHLWRANATVDKLISTNGPTGSPFFFMSWGGKLTTKHGVYIDENRNDFYYGQNWLGGGTVAWDMLGGTNVILASNRVLLNNGCQGLTHRVIGPGTVWTNRARTTIGYTGHNTQVIVSNGAAFYCPSALIGQGVNNCALIITGSNSVFETQTGSDFGLSGTGKNNLLKVADGGRAIIRNTTIYVASTGASSNRVVVTGADSLLEGTSALKLAYAGAGDNNGAIVSDGGTLRVNGFVAANDITKSDTYVTVSNAYLYVTNAANNALFDLEDATLTIDGAAGEVGADDLTIANSSTLKFVADVSGVTTVNVDDTLTLDASAQLEVDLTAFDHGGASQTLVLVDYGTKSGSFAPANITITGPFLTELDQDDGGKITLTIVLAGTVITVN